MTLEAVTGSRLNPVKIMTISSISPTKISSSGRILNRLALAGDVSGSGESGRVRVTATASTTVTRPTQQDSSNRAAIVAPNRKRMMAVRALRPARARAACISRPDMAQTRPATTLSIRQMIITVCGIR